MANGVEVALQPVNSEKPAIVNVDENRGSALAKVDGKVQIVFENLSYTVPVKVGKKMEPKMILKKLTGLFNPGRFTAIMGASGAGKTSLLTVLAGEANVPGGVVEGTVSINGTTIHGTDMKKLSGFVFQDDIILPTMTAYEAISMSALLRLPKSLPVAEKLQRVEDIMVLLGIEKTRNTIIGDSTMKGVSGGERKRIAMAMEMVTNPSILFADEPTSGLDTFTAFSVISTLSALARQGRTVVATIHQPSSEIFHMMDDLLLLAEGRVMYFGPAENVVDYFAHLGFQCPQYTNPADYLFMDILNNSESDQQNDKSLVGRLSVTEKKKEPAAVRVPRLLDAWSKSAEYGTHVGAPLKARLTGGISSTNYKERSGLAQQMPFLFKRAWNNALRNKLIVKARFFQTIFIGLFMGAIYWNIPGRGSSSQQQDRFGALFFIAINMVMSSAMGILAIFSQEKNVFIREYNAGYYRLISYFSSKILVELPFYIFFPSMLVSILYFMVGFQANVGNFFTILLVAVLLSNTGTALGIFCASLFNDLHVALMVVPMLLLPLMVFGGFFVNNGGIPDWLSWIRYLSPIKYAFAALVSTEFKDLSFPCQVNGMELTCNGNFIISSGNFDELTVAADLGVLVAFYAAFVILAFVSLYRITAR